MVARHAAKHSGSYRFGPKITAVRSAGTSQWTDTTCQHLAGKEGHVVPKGKIIKYSFPLKPIGHYMYRKVVTICTAQWSLYVQYSGHYMYRTVVPICTAQWSLYIYRTVITICTEQWSLYVPHSETICTVQWSLYVPYSGHYMYRYFNI